MNARDVFRTTVAAAPAAPAILPVAVPLVTCAAVGFAIGKLIRWMKQKRRDATKTVDRQTHEVPQSTAPEIASLGYLEEDPDTSTQALPAAEGANHEKPRSTHLFTRKLTADKVARVFSGGPLSRKEGVAALVEVGVPVTSAYRALREDDGPFAGNLFVTPEGLLEWKS